MLSVIPSLKSRGYILTPEEVEQSEEATFSGGVSRFELMQRAGRAVGKEVLRGLRGGCVFVLCGRGNNGGDAYLTACYLKQKGVKVKVYSRGACHSAEGRAAQSQWGGSVVPFSYDFASERFSKEDILVEGLCGRGGSGALSGDFFSFLQDLSHLDLRRFSIDLPLGGRYKGRYGGFQADKTITFSCLQRSHVLSPHAKLCGVTIMSDIGLVGIPKAVFLNHPSVWWSAGIFAVDRFAHKYQKGHVVVVGGEEEALSGACTLASIASYRMGSGVVSLVGGGGREVPFSIMGYTKKRPLKTMPLFRKASACVIGPGLGRSPKARQDVLSVLSIPCPVVIDADGLRVFASCPDELFCAIKKKKEPVVLTPHRGEFEHLFGITTETCDKIEATQIASERSGAFVVYKGATTIIAKKDCVSVHYFPNPTAAIAGSGDILSGLIAAGLGKSLPPFQAACSAVWCHSAAFHKLPPGTSAEDFLDAFPTFLKILKLSLLSSHTRGKRSPLTPPLYH